MQIPGILVDCVVLADANNHVQTYGTPYNHAFSGRQRVPLDRIEPMELDERKIIARRCAFELPLGGVVNLGIGMPEGVAAVAAEERDPQIRDADGRARDRRRYSARRARLRRGAQPRSRHPAESAVRLLRRRRPRPRLPRHGADRRDRATSMSAASGARLAGAGGFINISQNAKKLLFAGTFTVGGLEVQIEDGKLVIANEGKLAEIHRRTSSRSRSAAQYAAETGQTVLYVTERCVFQRTADGMELIEIAPGIDLERDILPHMGFQTDRAQSARR